MVDDVAGPVEADVVAETVEPVIGEVVRKKTKHPYPPESGVEGEDAELVNEIVNEVDDAFDEKADEYIAKAHGDAAGGVLGFVKIAVVPGGEDPFSKQQQHKTRDS